MVLVIGVRNRHGCRVAEHFGKVEIGSARVLMRPENLSHRVAEPRPTSSRAAAKIAGVLMQEGRVDALGHEIADREIGISGAEILRVSLHALAKSAIVVAQLALAGKSRRQHERSAIEGILLRDFEFLAGADRRIVVLCGKSPEVRNNTKDVFIRMRNYIIIRGLRPIRGSLLTRRD